MAKTSNRISELNIVLKTKIKYYVGSTVPINGSYIVAMVDQGSCGLFEVRHIAGSTSDLIFSSVPSISF